MDPKWSLSAQHAQLMSISILVLCIFRHSRVAIPSAWAYLSLPIAPFIRWRNIALTLVWH
jgi:hypothetical protein